MTAVAKKKGQRRSGSKRVRRAPQLTVRDNTDVHVTPPSAIVYPKVIEYRSGDYREVKGEKINGFQLAEIASGFKISVYQGFQAAKGVEGIAGRNLDEVVPGMCDVFAYAGQGGNSLQVEGWKVRTTDLERFARALLDVVEKGRRDGIFTQEENRLRQKLETRRAKRGGSA